MNPRRGGRLQAVDVSMLYLPTSVPGDYTLSMNRSIWLEEHGPTWTRAGSLNHWTVPDHCGAPEEVGHGP